MIAGLMTSSFGQTDSIEKKIAYDKCLKGEITTEDFKSMGFKWNDKIKEIKGYPDMPLDENGQVYFAFQYEYKGMMKIKIFNRIMEWIFINFGTNTNNYYSNLSEGKIIFNGNFKMPKMEHDEGFPLKCNQTFIITLKDEKMLIELFNFGYQFTIPAGEESNGNSYYWKPAELIGYSINSIYPVILKKPKEWDYNLDILKYTKIGLDNKLAELDNYIINYDRNYNF